MIIHIAKFNFNSNANIRKQVKVDAFTVKPVCASRERELTSELEAGTASSSVRNVTVVWLQ
jgi:hypothetical protein